MSPADAYARAFLSAIRGGFTAADAAILAEAAEAYAEGPA